MCPLMDQWTNRMWFIHTVVYYPAFKNHEILTHSTTGMNPEEVMLSKVSQTQPGKHYVTPQGLRCSVLYYVLFFSHSVVSDSLLPRGLQHARLPCPSLSPGVCSLSCPLSRWCHPAVSIMSISLQLGKLIHLISNILFSVKHMNNSLPCLIVYVNQENFKISVRYHLY